MKRTIAVLAGLAAAFALGWLAGHRAETAGPSVGREEMATALRSALHDTDPLRRASEAERLFRSLDRENLPAAVEAYRELASQGEPEGVVQFLGRWSELDLDSLVAEMKSWPEERSQAQGYGWAVYQLARHEGLAKATQIFGEVPDRLKIAVRFRLVEGAINGGDLRGVTEWAAKQEEIEDRQRTLQNIIQVLTRSGTDALISWFDQSAQDLPNRATETAFAAALQKLVRLDPQQAIDFRQARRDNAYAKNSMVPLALAWVDKDAPAAVDWVLAQPESQERDRALQQLVDRWNMRDTRAAVSWLDIQKPSPVLSPLYRRLCRSITISNPATATRFAALVDDPTERRAALTEVARYWFLRKPQDLRRWLHDSGVPEADAEEIIGELARKRETLLKRKAAAATTP